MTRPARKMKPSGIPWIGDVPADWEICKLKFVVNAFTGNSIKDEEKDFYSSFPLESSHPYIATKDIDKITGRINYESGLRTLKRDTLFKLAPKYSTLLCVEGGSAGEKIAFTEQDVSFVNKLCCFYTSSINKKYLFYFLSSSAFKECFKSFISGLIGGVPVSVFKNFNISIPPTETQKKIAEFLDKKCAEIDALIAIEEKMIAELKSYKQSVITEAVTRGVPAAANASRPLKDSGIPWLGSVPAHWEIRKIKSLGLLQGGNGFPEEFQGCFNEVIPFIKVKSLSENPIVVDGKDTISETTRAKLKAIIIPKNSIVFAKVGAALLLHRFRKLEFSTCIDNNMMAFIPSVQILPDFFVYAASLLDFSLFVNPGTVPSVNQEQVGNISVPCPDIKAQQKIVDFLDLKTQKIDSMISLKQEKVTSFQNYKRSIIFEYVTGKELI